MSRSSTRDLRQIAEFACEKARSLGAEQSAAFLTRRHHRKVVIRDGKWEELSGATQCNLSIRLFVDNRYAVHTTTEISRWGLSRFLDEAISLTRHLMPDKYRRLPESSHYSRRCKTSLGLHDQAGEKLTPEKRKELAQRAYEAARNGAGRHLISASAGFADIFSESVQHHSNGFTERELRTRFSSWATVSLKEPNGKRPSDWSQSASRRLSGLEAPEEMGRRAAKRATAWLGARKISSEKLPLIVANRAAGRLLGGLLRPLYGSTLYQRRSCFEGSLGKLLASEKMTLIDEPLLIGGLASRRYDYEGITASSRPVIAQGRLKSYFIDTYYGKKLKMRPTSGSSSNMVLKPGKEALDDLCRKAGRGILVTRFLGGNSNSTSGDFSHGIGGFLVEKGKVSHPVVELNIAGNHKKYWKGLLAVGADPYLYSSLRTPSLLLAPTMVAGK